MKHFYFYTKDTETNYILWSRFPSREDVVWGCAETEEQAKADCDFMMARFG